MDAPCKECLLFQSINEDGVCAECVICPPDCGNIEAPYCHCLACGLRKLPLNDEGECVECAAIPPYDVNAPATVVPDAEPSASVA